jgi:hypothetical protein
MLRAADPGDLRTEVLGELHGSRADRSGCAIDQDALPALDPSLVSKERECRQPSFTDDDGFLIGRIGRFPCQGPVFSDTDVLGVSTKAGTGRGDDLVTFGESLYLLAGGFTFPASSLPGIFFGLRRPVKSRAMNGSPFRPAISAVDTVVARTRIRTSFSFGIGSSTSSS